jgi:alkanesulfonate monooxygenase SsuD/methylene tetrahydromethanopterin reductase-like flavin-dependent oxidoreductase (luciferase family)
VVFRPQSRPERLLASAEAADSSGVDELWLWEDCFDHGGIASATAALARTERLHVGVGVLPVPLRNVALCAMEITTVARMFPGRLHAGVGHGVLDWMGQVGARVDSPMTLLREYTAALQALLAGERLSTAGRYVQLEDVQLGWPAEPKPELHVAAVRPKTIALAGELADGLVLTGATPPQDVAVARAAVDSARGERPGRTRITVYLMAVSGPDAQQRYERELADWQLSGADLGVAGDPDAVAAGVRRWADAGADTVVLQPVADEDPVAYARFVGEQIRPLV